MLLKNDVDGRNLLREIITNYYKNNGSRNIFLFQTNQESEPGWHAQCCLLERKHVFQYNIGMDRNVTVGGISLAIGPHYFEPAQFWSYENSRRFSMETSVSAIQQNLRLLDEFLGYPSNGQGQSAQP